LVREGRRTLLLEDFIARGEDFIARGEEREDFIAMGGREATDQASLLQ
jgi:hypothetical protein